MHSGSCLGPDLLSQLAELSLSAAELERSHPSPMHVSTPCQVRHTTDRQRMQTGSVHSQHVAFHALQSFSTKQRDCSMNQLGTAILLTGMVSLNSAGIHSSCHRYNYCFSDQRCVPLHKVNKKNTGLPVLLKSTVLVWSGRDAKSTNHNLIRSVFCYLQEAVHCTDEDAGSNDEHQQSSRCDISRICVEELSQTARHVTRQVQSIILKKT